MTEGYQYSVIAHRLLIGKCSGQSRVRTTRGTTREARWNSGLISRSSECGGGPTLQYKKDSG